MRKTGISVVGDMPWGTSSGVQKWRVAMSTAKLILRDAEGNQTALGIVHMSDEEILSRRD
jgi:hypothetical protein